MLMVTCPVHTVVFPLAQWAPACGGLLRHMHDRAGPRLLVWVVCMACCMTLQAGGTTLSSYSYQEPELYIPVPTERVDVTHRPD